MYGQLFMQQSRAIQMIVIIVEGTTLYVQVFEMYLRISIKLVLFACETRLPLVLIMRKFIAFI